VETPADVDKLMSLTNDSVGLLFDAGHITFAGGDPLVVLTERDAATVGDLAAKVPDTTRRWFTSFGSCSVLEPLEDLVNLGLIDAELLG
jgi:hypothetical protein